jgi:hypothetical protein
MRSLPEGLAGVPHLVLAAVLLVARGICQHFALPCPSVQQVLTATGASKSRAYELVTALTALLPTLIRSVGRPPSPPPCLPLPSTLESIAQRVLRYVLQHPGCAHAHAERQRYSDGFRRFLTELREQHQDIDLQVFAALVQVPLGTLKSWLSGPDLGPCASPEQGAHHDSMMSQGEPTLPQIETVLAAWSTWQGSFVDFCTHVREHLRVPLGRQLLTRILYVYRIRSPQRRPRRSPDEVALRGSFDTFFPGAQWVGDGKTVSVVIDHERIHVNLELVTDAKTDAFVGMSVRNTEDSIAVTDAFHDGVTTTGTTPIALLLDNRPSNHTPDVDAALGDTLRIRATPERPQNKAHVEGAFGLFAQEAPPLVLDTTLDKTAIARQLVALVATTWARAANHRPRLDRCGLSRVDLYGESPTDEQIAEARRALKARCKKQELARTTLEARQRPEVRSLLDAHFLRLNLLDPERHIRLAIARYPLDAIVDGIAIFEGKLHARTLPDGVDARYLLGIVRNVAAKTEGEHVAEALLRLRLDARDRLLNPLIADREGVCDSARDDLCVVADCIDRALDTSRSIDRLFWLGALVNWFDARTTYERKAAFSAAARRIYATFRVSPAERQDALRFLADRLFPLD